MKKLSHSIAHSFTFLSSASQAYNAVYRGFARKLPAFVVPVNYRLAPKHIYSSQYDVGFDVLKFLDENNATILPENADLSQCFLAGDSAGANLAHHVAVRACQGGFQRLKVMGLVSIQPFFEEKRTEVEKQSVGSFLVSVPRTDWCWKAFLPNGSNRDHRVVMMAGVTSICSLPSSSSNSMKGHDAIKEGLGWYSVGNDKTRGRGYGKENMDGLTELNKGPRGEGYKNRDAFGPATLAVKDQNLPSTVSNKENSVPLVPDMKQYNKEDFPGSCSDVKFLSLNPIVMMMSTKASNTMGQYT
ncbi:hypothetical protein REPUB_Repub05bG0126500 [Reevesia pubescens]